MRTPAENGFDFVVCDHAIRRHITTPCHRSAGKTWRAAAELFRKPTGDLGFCRGTVVSEI